MAPKHYRLRQDDFTTARKSISIYIYISRRKKEIKLDANEEIFYVLHHLITIVFLRKYKNMKTFVETHTEKFILKKKLAQKKKTKKIFGIEQSL